MTLLFQIPNSIRLTKEKEVRSEQHEKKKKKGKGKEKNENHCARHEGGCLNPGHLAVQYHTDELASQWATLRGVPMIAGLYCTIYSTD